MFLKKSLKILSLEENVEIIKVICKYLKKTNVN